MFKAGGEVRGNVFAANFINLSTCSCVGEEKLRHLRGRLLIEEPVFTKRNQHSPVYCASDNTRRYSF